MHDARINQHSARAFLYTTHISDWLVWLDIKNTNNATMYVCCVVKPPPLMHTHPHTHMMHVCSNEPNDVGCAHTYSDAVTPSPFDG